MEIKTYWDRCDEFNTASRIYQIKQRSKQIAQELLQIGIECIPFIQWRDLYHKKTVVSGLPIENNHQKRWRILLTAPQMWQIYIFSTQWKAVINNANTELWKLLYEQQLPQNISPATLQAMFFISISLIIYWFVKKWDALVYKKQRIQ